MGSKFIGGKLYNDRSVQNCLIWSPLQLIWISYPELVALTIYWLSDFRMDRYAFNRRLVKWSAM